MKYFYYARVIKEKKTGKLRAFADKISENINLTIELSGDESPGFENHTATPCPTYKKAVELAGFWNDCFYKNGKLYNYSEV